MRRSYFCFSIAVLPTAKGSPDRKDSPGRGRWHESAERGRLDAKRTERFYAFTKEIFIMNGLVALGAGIAALTGIGGGIGKIGRASCRERV